MVDIALFLDEDSEVPLHRQIVQHFSREITAGRLESYTKLPSARELALSVGIARGTVVKAYEELIHSGLVVAVVGAGTYVNPGKKELKIPTKPNNPSLSRAESEHYFSTLSNSLLKSNHSRATSSDFNKNIYGVASPEMLSETRWKQVISEQVQHFSVQNNKKKSTKKTVIPLDNRYCKQVLANYLNVSQGISCSEDQLILFQGAQQPLAFLSRFLIDPGDAVALENPSYSGARADFAFSGARLFPINTDDDGLRVDEIKQLSEKIKLLYCTPSYGEPTGLIMSYDRRKELIDWASSNDVLLIEDSFENLFCYSSRRLPALKAINPQANIFHIFSFWKLFYPINSLSALVVPDSFIGFFERAKALTDIPCSWLETNALASFISKGFLDGHLRKVRKIYVQRRQNAIYHLLKQFGGDIAIPRQSAAYHICVRFSKKFKQVEIEKAASKAGLSIVSTADYYLGNVRLNEFIIPFANQEPKMLSYQLDLFANLLL